MSRGTPSLVYEYACAGIPSQQDTTMNIVRFKFNWQYRSDGRPLSYYSVRAQRGCAIKPSCVISGTERVVSRAQRRLVTARGAHTKI